MLDVPVLKVDAIELDIASLRARVSLNADVLGLLRLNVGIDADVQQTRLDIRGVEAKALLKVRLDNLTEILSRVLDTLDAHPEMVEQLTRNGLQALRQAGDELVPALPGLGEDLDRVTQQVAPGAEQLGRAAQPVGDDSPILSDVDINVTGTARRPVGERQQALGQIRQAAEETRQARQAEEAPQAAAEARRAAGETPPSGERARHDGEGKDGKGGPSGTRQHGEPPRPRGLPRRPRRRW